MSPQRAGRNVGTAVVLGTQWGGLELSEEGGRGMAFQGRGEETHQIETKPDFRSKPWSSNQVGQVYDLEGLV